MKKIKKLDIWKETTKRETALKTIGVSVVQQQYDVIQDKINELIDAVNQMREEGKDA